MHNNKEVSPVKARLVNTSLINTQVFFFENPGNIKKIGISPNGKTKITLNKFEGKSHNRIRALDDAKLIMTSSSPVKSPYKNSLEAQMRKLEVKFIDLKNRSDNDYKIYLQKEQIDENHYKRCREEIKGCIKQLKICYRLSKDKEEFIETLNRRIKLDEIYNPFSLEKLYPKTGYESTLAAENFNHKLLNEDFCVKVPPLNLTPEVANKRKCFFDTQFVPRSVKQKTEKTQEKLEISFS